MANQQMINQMDLDFTGVTSFAYIPVGTHVVKVKDAGFNKAQTGSSQLEITFEDHTGATRKAWYNLLPQALWKVKQVLEALNIPCEGKIRLNAKALVGKSCEITVENDANDETRQIVTQVRALATTAAPTVTATAEAPATTPFVTPNTTPMEIQSSPSETKQEPVAQNTAAPQGNLPPWMQNAQAQASTTPNGNLPPWMRQQ